jgi:hypothetical protein
MSFERLSIESLKPEWISWDYLIDLLEQVPKTKSTDVERDQAYYSCLFELGCRATEALTLTDTNFMFIRPGVMTITDVPLSKRYDKLNHSIETLPEIPLSTSPSHRKLWTKVESGYQRKHYITERRLETRRLEIPLDEPLQRYLIPYVKSHRGVLFNRGYSYFYKLCRQLDTHQKQYPAGLHIPKHAFLHWFRSLRACQLCAEYGFTLHELVDFFYWKDLKTALTYAHLAGVLAQKMVTAQTTWRKSNALLP